MLPFIGACVDTTRDTLVRAMTVLARGAGWQAHENAPVPARARKPVYRPHIGPEARKPLAIEPYPKSAGCIVYRRPARRIGE